jgi:hypothetical protein
MKPQILYAELKQGHTGPAWIGYGQFSKTGRSLYFDGKVLKKARSIYGNYYDAGTYELYWVSGIKKNGQDRHWAGGGKIYIDKTAIDDYLRITGQGALPKNKFVVVTLNNIPDKDLMEELENTGSKEEKFDTALLHKKTPKDLTDAELQRVLDYYNGLNLLQYPLKSRRLCYVMIQ